MAERKHIDPKKFERSSTEAVQRDAGDGAALGTFSAVLASNGEATDGHILHIKGNKTPTRMPLLFGHRSDAMAPSLGSVTKPSKGKSADGKLDVLRTTQKINMDGEGQMADIRRNVAILVHNNDLNGMSLRWDPIETVRRIDLPRSHYAHVDANVESRDSERYWGYFHKASTSQEGSVVALGADPVALMGRAQELKGEGSSAFFRALAHSISDEERADGMGQLSTAFEAYQEAIQSVRKAGVSPDDLVMMMALDASPADLVPYHFTDLDGKSMSTMILRTAWEALTGESSRAYAAAIELHNQAPQAKAAGESKGEVKGESLTPEEMDARFDRVYPHLESKAKRVVTHYPIPIKKRTISDLDPEEFYSAVGVSISESVRAAVAHATGKVLD